jgi:hypothetical protein
LRIGEDRVRGLAAKGNQDRDSQSKAILEQAGIAEEEFARFQ